MSGKRAFGQGELTFYEVIPKRKAMLSKLLDEFLLEKVAKRKIKLSKCKGNLINWILSVDYLGF